MLVIRRIHFTTIFADIRDVSRQTIQLSVIPTYFRSVFETFLHGVQVSEYTRLNVYTVYAMRCNKCCKYSAFDFPPTFAYGCLIPRVRGHATLCTKAKAPSFPFRSSQMDIVDVSSKTKGRD